MSSIHVPTNDYYIYTGYSLEVRQPTYLQDLVNDKDLCWPPGDKMSCIGIKGNDCFVYNSFANQWVNQDGTIVVSGSELNLVNINNTCAPQPKWAVVVTTGQLFFPFGMPAVAPHPSDPTQVMSEEEQAEYDLLKAKPVPSTTGYVCTKCNEKNDYAESNQSDGTYICYNCRNEIK